MFLFYCSRGGLIWRTTQQRFGGQHNKDWIWRTTQQRFFLYVNVMLNVSPASPVSLVCLSVPCYIALYFVSFCYAAQFSNASILLTLDIMLSASKCWHSDTTVCSLLATFFVAAMIMVQLYFIKYVSLLSNMFLSTTHRCIPLLLLRFHADVLEILNWNSWILIVLTATIEQ